MAANCLGIESFEIKAGSPTKAVPGYDIQVLDEEGQQVPAGEIGAIVVKLPLPPGTLPTLWGADERYVNSYLSRYEGYYLTGDAGIKDENDYLWIMSRIDDVINVAGHRLSTGAMEEVLASHEAVAECAVFGVADQLKGELPLGMVVLKAGSEVEEETLRKELVTLVRQKIGPVAAFKLEEDRGRPGVQGAGDDRRPGDPRRDRRIVDRARLPEGVGTASRNLTSRRAPWTSGAQAGRSDG
jgi:propionyl-CoA synthetase